MTKKRKPVKAWAVYSNQLFTFPASVGRTRKEAIEHYVVPRGYDWAACVNGDLAHVERVEIRVLRSRP